MAHWLSGDVTANGIRIHYHRTGGDKPPLVLAHGATDNGLCWTRVARALQDEYDVIMPDARGHGRSEAPATGYTSTDHAADLAGLIRALGLRQPAVGGHSMGAASTLRLVANEPSLVRRAVLEDPPFRTSPWPAAASDVRESIRRSVRDAQASDVESTIRRSRPHSPSWSDDEWQPWAEAKMQVSPAYLAAFDTADVIPHDWRELLPRVSCPVLLVTSDPELGGIVSPEAADEAARLQPRLDVSRISGAGHNIRREQFDTFVDVVRRFLTG